MTGPAVCREVGCSISRSNRSRGEEGNNLAGVAGGHKLRLHSVIKPGVGVLSGM